MNRKKWCHPGGKLRELGADNLTEKELLAILISTGIKGKSTEVIAQEILDKFGSLQLTACYVLHIFGKHPEDLLRAKGLVAIAPGYSSITKQGGA